VCSSDLVVVFIDKNADKLDPIYCGLPVISSDNIDTLKNSSTIIVCTSFTSEVFGLLKQNGFEEKVDCFHADEFLQILSLYSKDILIVSYIETWITDYCQLKCKNCLQLNPYYLKRTNYDIDVFKADIFEMFKNIDYLVIFGIGGNGDSMLNPKCYEMLEWLGETFLDKKIGTIQLISNAIIPLNEKWIELFKKYRINYRWTDYGLPIQNSENTARLLEANGIEFNTRKLSHWIDTGYPQESNGLVSKADLIRHCKNCNIKTGLVYDRGLFQNCDLLLGADKAGYCKMTDTDYIDSRKLTNGTESKKILMEFFNGFSENGYYSYCKKCNGYVTVNPKKINIAEQITMNRTV
jgi:hypothetical protein